MSRYSIAIEVAGPLAMFARPDTGITPISYPVPTWSACKGILESIAMLQRGEAWFNPKKVAVCKRRNERGGIIRFQRYATNYGGPLRKQSQLSKGASFQFFATAVADTCYRIYADIAGARPQSHYLRDLFKRRLEQGRCYMTPSLGWREFTCSYWGRFREDEYETDSELNQKIVSMLTRMWDSETNGTYAPTFGQDIRISKGVVEFA